EVGDERGRVAGGGDDADSAQRYGCWCSCCGGHGLLLFGSGPVAVACGLWASRPYREWARGGPARGAVGGRRPGAVAVELSRNGGAGRCRAGRVLTRRCQAAGFWLVMWMATSSSSRASRPACARRRARSAAVLASRASPVVIQPVAW